MNWTHLDLIPQMILLKKKKNPWPLLDLYSLMTITEFWPWPYLTFLDIELVSPCTCPSIHWPPWGSFWGRCPCLWDSRMDGASWRCALPWSMGLFPACPHTSRSVKQRAESRQWYQTSSLMMNYDSSKFHIIWTVKLLFRLHACLKVLSIAEKNT